MKKAKNSYRKDAAALQKRSRPSQCDFGDWVRFDSGAVARVTCFLGTTPLGRYFDNGELGPLTVLRDDAVRLIGEPV